MDIDWKNIKTLDLIVNSHNVKYYYLMENPINSSEVILSSCNSGIISSSLVIFLKKELKYNNKVDWKYLAAGTALVDEQGDVGYFIAEDFSSEAHVILSDSRSDVNDDTLYTSLKSELRLK